MLVILPLLIFILFLPILVLCFVTLIVALVVRWYIPHNRLPMVQWFCGLIAPGIALVIGQYASWPWPWAEIVSPEPRYYPERLLIYIGSFAMPCCLLISWLVLRTGMKSG